MENSQVSQISVVDSLKPLPKSSVSPMTRAIRSPTGWRRNQPKGMASRPRSASFRTAKTVRRAAARRYQRLPTRAMACTTIPPV